MWQKLKIAYRSNPSLFNASLYFLRNTKLNFHYINSDSCLKDFFKKELGFTFLAPCIPIHLLLYPSIKENANAQNANRLKRDDISLTVYQVIGCIIFRKTLWEILRMAIRAQADFHNNAYKDLKKNLEIIHTSLISSFLPYNPFEK